MTQDPEYRNDLVVEQTRRYARAGDQDRSPQELEEEVVQLRAREESLRSELVRQEEHFRKRTEELLLANKAAVSALETTLAANEIRRAAAVKRHPVHSPADLQPGIRRELELNFVRRQALKTEPGGSRRSPAIIRRLRGFTRDLRIRKIIAASGIFDSRWYLEQYPDVGQAGQDALTHYVAFGAAEGRDPHPLFSSSWYLRRYPDVNRQGLNALAHYVTAGAAMGNDPHPLFSSAWYANRYPESATSGLTPLGHYIHTGASRGFDPHPLFDTAWYTSGDPGVVNAGINPLSHYVLHANNRDPHPLFHASWYLAQNPQIGCETNPLAHYLEYWPTEGGDPHPLFDTVWYREHYRVSVNPLLHYVLQGAVQSCSPSPLFDRAWYLQTYPEVSTAGRDPVADYWTGGAFLGRDPHPLFDSDWYLTQYPDVAEAGMNPLAHYLHRGRFEDCWPHPLFDSDWYCSAHPDVKVSNSNPLQYFVSRGAKAMDDPDPLFDAAWYAAEYPDVTATGLHPLVDFVSRGEAGHRCPNSLFDTPWYRLRYPGVKNPLADYLHGGASAGRNPNPIFDGEWYLGQYPDVARAGVNPLAHYLRLGWKENRDPHPLFDTDWYLTQYPDVATAGISPLADYLRNGLAKGRNPSPKFDGAWYLAQNPDVAQAGVNALAHYIQHGRSEGRRITPVPAPAGSPPVVAIIECPSDLEIALDNSRSAPDLLSAPGYSPLISVVLPTWNTPARYLHDALGSVFQQTYSNWELCIVDDGSTHQECLEILRKNADGQDKRIRVAFRPENGGIAASSQQGLEMARGDYVAFIDHDDMLAPNALAEVVAWLRTDPEVAMIYTDHAMMNVDGKLLEPVLKPGWSPEFFLSTNYLVHLKVIRRDVAMAVGGFKDTLHGAQDTGLICKLLGDQYRVAHLPRVLYFWRTHRDSVASGTSAKPAIESAALETYNRYLAAQSIDAQLVWPHEFRTAKVGAYKLRFRNTSNEDVAVVVVVPDDGSGFDAARFLRHYERTDYSPVPSLHVITPRASVRSARNSRIIYHETAGFSETTSIIGDLRCKSLVFLSLTAKLLHRSWLAELLGYLAVSPRIGAVGGKVLGDRLEVRTGGLLLLDEYRTIAEGASDDSDGYWFRNRIASNVEAVSARLMATRQRIWHEIGGICLDEPDDAVGPAYCLKLRAAGYRVVYNPWSKLIDSRPGGISTDIVTQFGETFGKDALDDKYYHPMHSRTVPYQIRRDLRGERRHYLPDTGAKGR